MKLWIARDSDGELVLHKDRPIYYDFPPVKSWCSNEYVSLPFDLFTEITFENSPQQVEIKLINNYDNNN